MIELRWLQVSDYEMNFHENVVFCGNKLMVLQYWERIDTDADGQPIYTDWQDVPIGVMPSESHMG